ncbi:MAG: hypothetical protein ACOCP8_04820, partial [archaeon]
LTSEYENASYLYSFENGDLVLENEYDIIKHRFYKRERDDGEGRLVFYPDSKGTVDIYEYEFESDTLQVEEDNWS